MSDVANKILERKNNMKKGKFIVIDGTDGSGKATQTELLLKRLKKHGLKVKKIDFPRYYENFFGKLIGECLAGKYGQFIHVDPHIASVLYAADRWESSAQIKKWLDSGVTVVADRYVSSNQIHQGGKIKHNQKRAEFLHWLDTMEHKVFKIPRPDMLIHLHVPAKIGFKLLKAKSLELKKRYLEGKKDLAENDLKHLEDSRRNALKLVKELNNWHQIDCAHKDGILPREEIHELVFSKVKNILNIK
jgi:dTMP kinase